MVDMDLICLKYLMQKNTFFEKIILIYASGNDSIDFAKKTSDYDGAPDKPCGVGCADVNPKLLLNDT